jgi:hypothetical protein
MTDDDENSAPSTRRGSTHSGIQAPAGQSLTSSSNLGNSGQLESSRRRPGLLPTSTDGYGWIPLITILASRANPPV